MSLEGLLVPLVALVLAVRSVVSHDVRWIRVVAACLAVLPLLIPPSLLMLVQGAGLRGSPPPWYGAALVLGRTLPALFLIIWLFVSRDPLWVRISSAALGAFAILPTLGLLLALVAMAPR